jgi:uncharacterized protein
LPDSPLFPTRGGLRLAIRLSPRAKADRLNGMRVEADGVRVLAAMVRAPAENGRADDALLRFLARTLSLPRRDLSIVAGVARRRKTVHIAGNPQQLFDRLAARMVAPDG